MEERNSINNLYFYRLYYPTNDVILYFIWHLKLAKIVHRKIAKNNLNEHTHTINLNTSLIHYTILWLKFVSCT